MSALRRMVQAGILATLVTICGAAFAQAPHSLTYSQISVAPGTVVDIAGIPHVAVQVPVRRFTVDKRYAVRFLTPLIQNGEENFVSANILTQHTNEPLPSSNATIDGIPAQIELLDSRTYSINTGFDPMFNATNRLTVDAFATATIYMKLGADTLLIYTCFDTKVDHDVELGPNEYRGTAQAAYGRYTDPIGLINQLDKCIDYFRVIALN